MRTAVSDSLQRKCNHFSAFAAPKFGSLEGNTYLCTEMTSRRDKQKAQRSLFYDQIESMEEEKLRKEDAGKLLLWKSRLITNVGNLVFAGVVIGGVFEDISSPLIVFGSGIFVASFSYLLGYYLYKRGIKLWRQ